ncbi:TolC family protein [Geomonas sp. Red69]|uniref:TolC family protein n=1 Tax=Geomonas diazotrophica TaxID=2843197 RepID=A0ABX8JKV0_9BACT|nr:MULTISPECIES: TolC family protein [Geomonas]MBU5636492.1 TolC family protein [Geomonas diazotrophica]QWV99005.1 TolC family protein [Geomonas nitrogeniifigens]QXE88171.1 TolC family protein [Geomonas nitrogeniifigens]
MHLVIVLLALLCCGEANTAHAQTLTLREALDRAAATSQGLKSASHEVEIAREQVNVARSTRLPRIDLQGGYVAQAKAQAFKFGTNSQETQDPRYPFFNFSVYQTLYDFGRTRANEGIARMRGEAARYSYSGNEQELFLQVVQAYYGIMTAQKLVQAASDEVVQMESHQKTAQALFDEGVVTRNDLLQAEVRVASSRQNVLSAQNEVENGWLLLNYLTGAAPGFRAELKDESQLPQLPSTSAQPDLSSRGEIAAQKALLGADEFAVTEAKTSHYPEFFAKLGVDYLSNSKVREQAITAVTVGFKVNLFDGPASAARVRQAVQARSRDEERLRDLEDRTRLEYAMAVNDLKVADARIKVAEKAITQGVENLRITKDRYQEHVGTATEVVDAQTLLTKTRTDYYRSVFDLQVAAARVKRATGEL